MKKSNLILILYSIFLVTNLNAQSFTERERQGPIQILDNSLLHLNKVSDTKGKNNRNFGFNLDLYEYFLKETHVWKNRYCAF